VTTGNTNTVCASTIALRLNNQPSDPNGPVRDNNKYTNKPTTTEGKASKVLSTVSNASRPVKRATPSQAPSTTPMLHAIAVASTLTHSERPTMDQSTGSNSVSK
jgi:hypothetical protein